MSVLNIKQRTKVNAALSIIHSQGHDAQAVSRHAHTIMATGRDRRYAYETAINRFISSNPDMHAPLSRVTQLIEASDAATVQRYDHALSEYIETGDEARINHLAPMVRADSLALAVKNGELSAEDAATGNVDWQALGLEAAAAPVTASFAFTVPGQSAPAATPASAPPLAPAPQAAGRAISPRTAAAPAFGNGSQVSPGGNVTGFRTPETAARFNNTLLPTTSRQSPYAGMAPAQIREAMQADMAGPRGWQRPADQEG